MATFPWQHVHKVGQLLLSLIISANVHKLYDYVHQKVNLKKKTQEGLTKNSIFSQAKVKVQ